MPRLMSFAKTIDQIRNRTKTVTRRTGWEWLEPGTALWAVDKAMGLKKGEKVVRICKIRVVDVRRERLEDIVSQAEACKTCNGQGSLPISTDVHYSGSNICGDCRGCGLDNSECAAEGFPIMTPPGFRNFFTDEMGCDQDTEVTRIEFRHLERSQCCDAPARVDSSDEGTRLYRCDECGEGCGVVEVPQ